MAVQMQCTGCGKMQPPYMNQKTEEVFCSLCDVKIAPVNHFIKMQLKALKQYQEQKKVAFGVKCQKCGKEEKPKDTGKDIVCGACGKSLDHLTDAFKRMLKAQLPKADQDV
jgi:DNA-directed RNA polymerase subunit RPC12/RpoP